METVFTAPWRSKNGSEVITLPDEWQRRADMMDNDSE